jgi:SAM-dependent methyltransferase
VRDSARRDISGKEKPVSDIAQPRSKPSAEHFLRVQESGLWQELHREFAGLLPAPRPGAQALDVGCGPGLLCGQLAGLGWRVSGVDLAEDMVAAARERFPEHRFVQGDACHLSDFASSTLDLVTSTNLLFFLPDPVVAVREAARVCRPGGVVATLNPHPSLDTEVAERLGAELGLDEWDRFVLWNWARLGELNGTFDDELGPAMFELAGLTGVTWQEVGPGGIGAAVVGRLAPGAE